MRDRRKKVFFMSLLAFLVTASGVYVFFIFDAVNDLKSRPYFATQYSGAKRVIIPVLKYLGVVDTEAVSDPKKISEEDIEKASEMIRNNSVSTQDMNEFQNVKNDSSSSGVYSYSAYGKGSKASSKLSSQLSGDSTLGSSASNTSALKVGEGFSSKTGANNIEIQKNTNFQKNKTDVANNLVSRLNATKTLMASALNAKSADASRMDWEKGFSGSIKPENKMLYKNNSIELDKMKAGVMDLKMADEKGLKAPDVGKPQIDSESVSADKTKELMKSLTENIAQSMISSLGSGLGAGMGGGGGSGEMDGVGGDIRGGDIPSQIKNEVDKWKFNPQENVQTTFFPCGMIDCDKMGVSGGGLYKAYFPDGFVLSLSPSGQPLNYYYCVSPNNEAAFLQNYQTYVLGN
ncbi:MAG: hypothetical protein K6357_06910 [Elusimicrobiota bacterium]